MAVLRSVWSILTPEERRRGLRVFGLVIALGILETGGVASVMPFLLVSANPALIHENEVLNRIYSFFGFSSDSAFLLVLGTASLTLLLTGSAFRVLTNYSMLRFVSMQRHALAMRLFVAALSRPYAAFLNRNSSDLAKSILAESNEVVSGLLKPLVDVVAHAVVGGILVAFLVAYDPLLALVVAGTFGGAYGLVYLAIRDRTRRYGRLRVAMNRVRFRRVSEAFGGIKEVKLRGLEEYFLEQFEPASRQAAEVQANNAILAQVPRYCIEAVAFGVVMTMAIVVVVTGRNFGEALPVLGLYALAGYRLLPAFQNVYSGIVKVRFGMGALESVAQELDDGRGGASAPAAGDRTPLVLRESLVLEGVSFTYPHADRESLRQVNLTIPVHTSVGIVGPTGAGKTTVIDLILGLLTPTGGRLLLDGCDVSDVGLTRWQASVGYVPQVIYMADASVAANIAFGVPASEVDMGAVERAAEAAQASEFIRALPQGFDTAVGERGLRLSGGQRQRIGIARALYHDPQVLVLDEGTSALDGITENAVMEAVASLSGRKTIILVAHRLTTVRLCDQIAVMEDGRVREVGRFSDLMANSDLFRNMARSGADSSEQDRGLR